MAVAETCIREFDAQINQDKGAGKTFAFDVEKHFIPIDKWI